jgi:hypothetical protein
MSKETKISITPETLLKYALRVGISRKNVMELISLLLIEHGKTKSTRRKTRKPKLAAVLNPSSKYYDNTPNLTTRLSIIYYDHQTKRRRLKHKRITNNDRQWVLLVQIKQNVLDAVGLGKFLPTAKKVFDEAELIAKERGSKFIYLTNVVASIELILDRVIERETAIITVKESRVYRAYRKYRRMVTGKRIKDLEPGSQSHNYVTQITTTVKEYGISAKVYMDVQFRAFAHFDSFPRLKDLTTEKAIDRLEQGLPKYREENIGTDEDKEYWKDVRNRIDE